MLEVEVVMNSFDLFYIQPVLVILRPKRHGMNLYSREQLINFHDHHFAFLEVEEHDHVLSICLARERKKNALHPHMMSEIAYAMHYAHYSKNVWMLHIKAKGNIFCAGADLKAMLGIIEEHDSSVPAASSDVLLGDLFNTVHKPTIAQVDGDVYAGGFFFLAGCTIVVAREGLKFGLPEVKRGLYPFQVMAALLKVMPARKVIDWCIRGYNLPVSEAKEFGLVTEVCVAGETENAVKKIIEELKGNSPNAISKGLEAFDHIQPASAEHQYLYDMLQATISSKDGQEGLAAFKEKRTPNWTGE